MKGDFSRLRFDPDKKFVGVLMQQGRVLLDSDWNEQVAILLHSVRSLAADLIGPHGGPNPNPGFKVAKSQASGSSLDLVIGPGRYYVDGILCEAGTDKTGKPYQYFNQPHLPGLEGTQLPAPPFLVYLDVWERHVTHVQDESLREVALGTVDTATRAQLVWQVRVTDKDWEGKPIRSRMPAANAANRPKVIKEQFASTFETWVSEVWQPRNRGRLRARAMTGEKSTDPCLASPDARYRGDSNRLYRVEIQSYEADGKGLTFKWSRDNGSVVFPLRRLDELTAHLEHLGLDDASGLKRGDWVELVDDVIELSGTPGPLLRVEGIDAARSTVTLAKAAEDNSVVPDITPEKALERHALLRRWDHREAAYKAQTDKRLPKGGVLVIFDQIGDDWIDLEDGVQVRFADIFEGAKQVYRPGDYWLIPARTATGDVEWPGPPEAPEDLRPFGAKHYFAPLAIIDDDVFDLRRGFDPRAVPL